ncbi:MAG: phosphatidate cytidylyltransferase [Lachnospiraceae bacterium]|nr:phosphatidate cytidylyltransferase [Lachnospiraceae bacterium]
MFKQRLMSGIVLVVILAAVLYFGGMPTFLMTAAVSLVGYYELLKVFETEKSPIGVIGYTVSIVYYVLLMVEMEAFILPLSLILMIALLSVYVLRFPKYHFRQVSAGFFGFFYVTIMLSYVYQIRMLEAGGIYVVLLFLGSWGNDTLAYCAGRLLGKHKMSPVLSPKKTIEGAVGGVAGAGLLGFLYSLIAKHFILTDSNLSLVFAVICMVGALISIIGDLAASAIKRNYDIKDYGTLIPGHGGILDRFDSVIFIAPIIYYFLIYTVGA